MTFLWVIGAFGLGFSGSLAVLMEVYHCHLVVGDTLATLLSVACPIS